MLEDAMGGEEAAVRRSKDELGVLLVHAHGVGRQAHGKTLIAAANPIYEFLNRLPDTKGRIDMVDCLLRPRFGPAHLRLQFKRSVKGPPLTGSWLMAEAHWADSFPAVSFGELLRWSFAVLPWALVSHFGAGVLTIWQTRKLSNAWWGKLWWGVRLLQALALTCAAPVFYLAVHAMLLLAFVIAIIPSPHLRSVARGLQQRVGSTIGDSYLLSLRVQAAAMTSVIARDLRWLARRCEKVAVIAHSQGAALSYMVLRGHRPKNLVGFLTYGSGIKKLLALETATEGEQVNLRNAWIAVGSMAMALLAFVFLFVHPPLILVTVMAWVALLLILSLAISVRYVSEQPELEWLRFLCIALAGFVVALGISWAFPFNSVTTSLAFGVPALFATMALYFVGRETREAARKESRARQVALLCAAAATPAVLVAVLSRLNVSVLSWQLLVIAVVGVPMFLLEGLVVARSREIRGFRETVGVMHSSGIQWKDLYASRDPVAQGGISALGEYSTEIHNRDSFWSDHTTYWKNADEFVPQVTEWLFSCAGWDGRIQWPDKGKTAQRRKWRVAQLAAARSAVLSVWLLLVLSVWAKFVDIEAKLKVFAPFAKRFALPGVAPMFESVAPLLGSKAGRIGASCIVVSALALAVYVIVTAVWRAEDRDETRLIQQGQRFVPERSRGRLIPSLMILLLIAGILWLGPQLLDAIVVICTLVFWRPYFGRAPDKPAE